MGPGRGMGVGAGRYFEAIWDVIFLRFWPVKCPIFWPKSTEGPVGTHFHRTGPISGGVSRVQWPKTGYPWKSLFWGTLKVNFRLVYISWGCKRVPGGCKSEARVHLSTTNNFGKETLHQTFKRLRKILETVASYEKLEPGVYVRLSRNIYDFRSKKVQNIPYFNVISSVGILLKVTFKGPLLVVFERNLVTCVEGR